jgi:hypothetical protein
MDYHGYGSGPPAIQGDHFHRDNIDVKKHDLGALSKRRDLVEESRSGESARPSLRQRVRRLFRRGR